MPKKSYGVDAPSIIIFFLVLGICLLAVTIWFHDAIHHSRLLYIVSLLSGLFAAYFLSSGLFMILSSQYGKIKVITKMLKTLPIKGHEKILDVGCGRGMLLIEVAKKLKTGKAVGIDIWRSQDQSHNSKQMTEFNAKLENVFHVVEIVTCDMTKMIFSDNSFDFIVSSLAIHNINNKFERIKALQEIARVLKPSGQLTLMDFQFTEDYANFFKESGFSNVKVSCRDYRMFPPVRIVTAQKPSIL